MSDAGTLELLVVDDEPDMVRGLRRILRAQGHRVDVAHSGEEAVEKTKQMQPDGLLMDIRMPGMNGVEAYRHIRRQCPDAFVVFMTAYSDLVEEARQEGAIEVLAKPLDIEHLCPLLERAANTRPILIVDDDLDFCRSLERNLLGKEFKVRLARTAAEALEIFEQSPRALVLLDMFLPDESGLDVLRRLKKLNKNALVIQMSGVPEMQDDMQAGLNISATGYLTKPFEMDELFKQLEIAANRWRKPK